MKPILLLILALAVFAQKAPKPIDIETVEIMVSREDNKLTIDGRAKNVSIKPIRKLKVIFEVLDSDGKVLTKQATGSEEDEIEPGEEIEFHVQMGFHARAVHVRLTYEDASGHELRTPPSKPTPID